MTKTRTQIGSNQGEAAKSKDLVSKEDQFRAFLKEADALMISHQEVNKLREHIEQIDQWKFRVQLFLEDDRDQVRHKEAFTALLKETTLFKVDLALTEDLQRRFEFIEWHEKVKRLFRKRAQGEPSVNPETSSSHS